MEKPVKAPILFVKTSKRRISDLQCCNISVSDMMISDKIKPSDKTTGATGVSRKNFMFAKDEKEKKDSKKRQWSEKLFWSIVFIFSSTSCSLMIFKTYNKWSSSPIIISFDDRMTPVSQIPFPAITVCPELRIGGGDFDFDEIDKKVSTLKKLMKNEKGTNQTIGDVLTKNEQKIYEALMHVCDYKYTTLTNDFDNVLAADEIIPTLTRIENDQKNKFECSYKKIKNKPCTMKTLNRVGIGICRTFNSLSTSDFFNVEK